MGAPRKPTAIKEVQGTHKRNKTRINPNEPKPERGIGEPHKSLTEYEQSIWDEVVGIYYADVLGEADRIALEMMCRLIAEMRLNFEEMTAAKITQLSQLAGRFGMTPSDRTKISIPTKKKSNPFESI